MCINQITFFRFTRNSISETNQTYTMSLIVPLSRLQAVSNFGNSDPGMGENKHARARNSGGGRGAKGALKMRGVKGTGSRLGACALIKLLFPIN